MRNRLKCAVVRGLERLCGLLDAIPSYEGGRWYRYGDWGCRLRLAKRALDLDLRWGIEAFGRPTGDAEEEEE